MDVKRSPSLKGEINEKTTKAIVLLTFFAALGGFLFGYDTGVISGAMLLIRKEFSLSTLWQELIVSITIIGAWVAALIAGPAADYFGRRKVIMFSSLVFIIGSVVLAAAPSQGVLLAGRTIVGFGIGFTSMCVPVYISEVSPPSSRGRLTVIFALMITGGQFFAAIICGLFSGVREGWRWMLGLAVIPAFIQMVAFIFSPESPRWLTLHGRFDDAERVLEKYRHPTSDFHSEIESIKREPLGQVASLKSVLTSTSVRRALILGCLLQLFQQLAGINTVMYYSASIIAMAGVSDNQTAIWLSSVTAFFNFSFTFVGLWVVERFGRRPLLLGSLLGVALALLSLGLSFHLAYLTSPSVLDPVNSSSCANYKLCSSCVEDRSCGFCFMGDMKEMQNSSCLAANHSMYDAVSIDGLCAFPEENDAEFAYNWCPSPYAWLSVLGLCLYLCFFAPGMGPMPWSINSEIYPNWARARCTSIATSFNWAANIFVSLTFLSLTENITKHGTFYLYTCFALSGLAIFFFILPETKGTRLEEVESIFQTPLCSQRPWKKRKEADELMHSGQQDSYGTL